VFDKLIQRSGSVKYITSNIPHFCPFLRSTDEDEPVPLSPAISFFSRRHTALFGDDHHDLRDHVGENKSPDDNIFKRK